MPSVRDNTDFLYQAPDIVNPVYESSRHTHNIVHVAELAGLGVGYLSTAAIFLKGASLGMPEDKSLKNLWANKGSLAAHGSEFIEQLNMVPAGLSALTAGTIALAYGKNWEEKLQGASLGAAEFTAERLAQRLGNHIIDTYFSDFNGNGILNKNSARWLAREVGGGVLGLALIPAFNYTFKNIGKAIDHVRAVEDESDMNSPHHPHVARRYRHKDSGNESRGKLRTKTKIDDENPSRRDVEEQVARHIVHGRAF